MKSFRFLNPDEVEVRPNKTTDKTIQLLLYQDARCAMNILDSTLGPMAWQREYYEAGGLLFCKIGIYDSEKNQWIWKGDTGSKSNIEEDKGLASDAFKRAAVAWGIGRELYTTPRIIIDLSEKDFFNGKVCQTFHVGEMEVNEGVITKLTILDKWDKVRFSFTSNKEESTIVETKEPASVASNNEAIKEFCSSMKGNEGIDIRQLKKFYTLYTGPSKKDPSKSVAECFPKIKPQALWEKWLEKSSNKAA